MFKREKKNQKLWSKKLCQKESKKKVEAKEEEGKREGVDMNKNER